MAAGSYSRSATILRVRAGLLLLVAFIVFSWMVGSFIAKHLGLGFGWGLLVAVLIAVGVGVLLARLDLKIYAALSALFTAFGTYTAYDFSRVALDWSQTVSLVLAGAVGLLLALTCYDFRRLKGELIAWARRLY